MEVDRYFAPPDPSGEVFLPSVPSDSSGEVTLPVAPPEPDRPSTKVRAAMVVAVALVAVAGLFFVGRWTTGGERSALADERDAAQAERDQLQSSLDEAQQDLADAAATNTTNQSTIDELESAAARDAAELTSLQANITQLTDENDALQATNATQWADIESVGQCADVVTAADTAIDDWHELTMFIGDHSDVVAGSQEEADALEQVAVLAEAVDDAETELTGASARCTAALDALPDCENDPASLRLVNESQEPSCLTTD